MSEEMPECRLPAEVVEKIIVEVLVSGAKTDFLNCREVSRAWRDCVDDVIKRMDSIPKLQDALNNAPIICGRHEFFANFLVPTTATVEEDDNLRHVSRRYVTPHFDFSELLPHYQDFFVHKMTMRSDHFSQEQEVYFKSEQYAKFTAISSQYAIVFLHSNKVRFYRLSDSVLEAEIYYNDYYDPRQEDMKVLKTLTNESKEYLVCCSNFDDVSFVDLTDSPLRLKYATVSTLFDDFCGKGEGHSQERCFTNVGFGFMMRLPPTPFGIGLEYTAVNFSLQNEKGKRYVRYSDDNTHTELAKCWPPFSTIRSSMDHQREVISRGEIHGEFGEVVRSGRIGQAKHFCVFDDIKISVNQFDLEICRVSVGLWETRHLFKADLVETFSWGQITAIQFDSNVLFLGTSNGQMRAYIIRRMDTMNEDLDLNQPDFSYCHEQAKPVLSISVGKYDRRTDSVNILVLYPDHFKVINKKSNIDLTN